MEISPPFARWNASATSTPNDSSTSGMTTSFSASAYRSEPGHLRAHAYFKHSKCPYLAAPSHVFSSQGHPFSRAYRKHSKCPFLAALVARSARSQSTPVARARTSQTLQVSIRGGIRHVHSSQGHPCSRAYSQTLQMSIHGGIRARPRPKDTRCSRAYSQTLQMSILGGILHVHIVPRTPVLVRVLQRLQIAEIQRHTRTSIRPTAPRARARTSYKPNLECA